MRRKEEYGKEYRPNGKSGDMSVQKNQFEFAFLREMSARNGGYQKVCFYVYPVRIISVCDAECVRTVPLRKKIRLTLILSGNRVGFYEPLGVAWAESQLPDNP